MKPSPDTVTTALGAIMTDNRTGQPEYLLARCIELSARLDAAESAESDLHTFATRQSDTEGTVDTLMTRVSSLESGLSSLTSSVGALEAANQAKAGSVPPIVANV